MADELCRANDLDVPMNTAQLNHQKRSKNFF